MQSNYPACLAFTLLYEGGKVNDARDPGGRTNQGITQATYEAFRKGRGQSLTSVYAMTNDERDAIYASGFWDKVGGAALPAGVDLATFDYGVNSGPARAVKALPKDRSDAVATVKQICASRSSFLHALKTWATFGKGWSKRVAACEALGVKMALQQGTKHESPAIAKTDLEAHADSAKGKAAATKTAATASATANVAPIAATGHVSLWLIAAVMAVLLVVAVYFAWHASHHAARAEAYSDLAKGS